MKKSLSYWSALVLAAAAASCTSSSPTRPADVSTSAQASAVTDARTGVTLTTPQPLTPTNSQQLKFADQPLTLTFKNGVTTGSTTLTYSVQVANDFGFASIAYSKDGIPETPGQTAVKIDTLPGPQTKTYYWRVRSTSSSVTGLFSPIRSFTVGPQVVISAPGPVSPGQGGTLNGTASLIVTNATKSGPAGQLSYRFEVSDSQSFGNLVFVGNATEGSGQTSVQMNANLTTNATYWWRAQASDPSNGVTGPYSSVNSFRYVPFDMSQASIFSSPADLGFWPETAKITSVVLNGDGIQVDFDRRQGPNQWPNEPFGSGSIEYTLGMCLNIDSHWDCSAVVLFWEGRELSAGGLPWDVARNWFYDARWGPLMGHQPAQGETVGLFVGSGMLRGRNDPGYVNCPRVCERSNVVLVPWSDDASYTFSLGKKVVATRRR